ncbi:hypothetical protein AVEN_128226-1 [Araneus ventricosus]|uniref:Uncharacterized protein n=1 Tax=Araneus ventricosus TaxID=182803 RepID=A0A4Y2A117_ARAVE|nr:hypothetical protein AVEN_128226-1 [Araneus ventricosus]
MKLPQDPKKPRRSNNEITDEERLLLYAELAEEQRRARYGHATPRPRQNGHTPNGHIQNGHTQNGKPHDEPLR